MRAAGLAICVFLAACSSARNDGVHVRVTFSGGGSTALTDVRVIVGSDKFFWPRLAPGQSETVTLGPHPKDERQLTLLYSLEGLQRSWEGPQMPDGAGYRIAMSVSQDGTVTYRQCLLPCRLD